jgi:hypothetical protein
MRMCSVTVMSSVILLDISRLYASEDRQRFAIVSHVTHGDVTNIVISYSLCCEDGVYQVLVLFS